MSTWEDRLDAEKAPTPKPTFTRGSVTSDRVRADWLAIGWLARRKTAALIGEEGIGKSLWWIYVAAAITRGHALPEINLPAREPLDVIVIATEDEWTDIEERIKEAGGDPSRLIRFSLEIDGDHETPIFPANEADLIELVGDEGLDVGLIVVDVWLDTVEGKLSVRDTQNAAAALRPWKHIAEATDAAVLLIGHTNRVSTGSIRESAGATDSLRKKARIFLYALQPMDDEGNPMEGRLCVGPDKANGVVKQTAVEYRVTVNQLRPRTDEDPGTGATLSQPMDTRMSIGRIKKEAYDTAQHVRKTETKREAAKEWIIRFMASRPSGYPAGSLKDKCADAVSTSPSTVERAMKDVGVTKKIGYSDGWMYFTTEQGNVSEAA